MALAIASILPLTTKAEDQAPTEEQNNGWVEVRSSDAAYKPYLQRRQEHGWMIAFGLENYAPANFTSQADGATFDEMFSGDFQMPFIEGGYKQNLGAISLGLVLNYTSFNPSGYAGGSARDFYWERQSAKLMLIFDGIMDEPKFAPYVSAGVFKMAMDEDLPALDLKYSGETAMGSMLTVGLLLQLNWIEPDSARWAWLNAGVENTYLDLFMTQHGTTSGDDDPDVSSQFNWGAGLRIEF